MKKELIALLLFLVALPLLVLMPIEGWLEITFDKLYDKFNEF
jgi:hypothetical protein